MKVLDLNEMLLGIASGLSGTGGEPQKLQELSKNTYLCTSSSGCCPAKWQAAEKIPAEPDQGNACAGKVISSISIPLLLRHFPVFYH